MKINLKSILFLPLVLFFFPAFCINISGTICLYFYFVLNFILFLLIIVDRKDILAKIINAYRKTPFKYLVLTLLFLCINSICLSLIGIAPIGQTFRSIAFQVFTYILPIIVYFIYIIDKYIHFKKFMAIFILFFWLILVIGFLSFIGQLFDIGIINSIFDILANQRLIMFSNLGITTIASNYTAFNIPRLDNLYAEPAFYARFLLLFLPLVYAIGFSNFKIFNNKYLNFIIKNTLVLFTLLSMVLTQSPIYLIFTIVITISFFHHQILDYSKKHLSLILSIFIFLVIGFVFLTKFDYSNTYIGRIFIVIKSFRSIEQLILAEGSLAIRVINFYNTICVFLKHPLFGIGIGNLYEYQFNQLLQSNITLHPAIVQNMHIAITTNTKFTYNSAFVYSFLAENGIFVFSLFVYFHILMNKIMNKIIELYGNNQYFFIIAKGLCGCWLSITILAFYHINFTSQELWFIYAIMIAFILHVTNNKEEINEKNNLNR